MKLDPGDKMRITNHARYSVKVHFDNPERLSKSIDNLNVRNCKEYRKAIFRVFADEYKARKERTELEQRKVEVMDNIESKKRLYR